MNPANLLLFAVAYMALLFLIAHRGDVQAARERILRKPVVWTLAIAVYCTSWTYYGAVGVVADSPLSYLPIYLGPILIFTLGYPLLRRMITLAKRNSLTSIADFVAARYGNDPKIAVLATAISVLAVLPYIALQLKAISSSFGVVSPAAANWDIALLAAIGLGFFTILFGTRHISASESHHGLMLVMAFESLIKLLAFLLVAAMVLRVDLELTLDAYRVAFRNPAQQTDIPNFICHTILAALAVFCLPRQFHIMAVENASLEDLKTARWMFPLYLVLLGIPVIPLAALGAYSLNLGVDADTYMLALPIAQGQYGMAAIAYIGGLSASTAMVIMGCIALSTMVSNEVVMPNLLARGWFTQKRNWGDMLKLVRRLTIISVLLFAYVIYRTYAIEATLADIGLLAFVGIAQLAPSFLGALYWQGGNRHGAFAGMLIGSMVWIYTLVIPAFSSSAEWLTTGPFGLSWLIPHALLGWQGLDPIVHASIFSLGTNILAFVLISRFSQMSLQERLDAARFITPLNFSALRGVHIGELQRVLGRFYGRERAEGLMKLYATEQGEDISNLDAAASSQLLEFVERLLAAAMGASTARALLETVLEASDGVSNVDKVLDQTSDIVRFNRELLQSSLDNLTQGVSVIDADQRLVAWNRTYVELFNLPPDKLRVGESIETIVRYNAMRGLLGPGPIEEEVERRMNHLRGRTPHRHERYMPTGRYLEIAGEPMPGGGFISTFTDITDYKSAQRALQEANQSLESRVAERTRELEALNQELELARSEADAANSSKTRFLAAASHDLMQPLNAARLFASAAVPKSASEEVRELLNKIELSMDSMEDLLGSLLEISKIDAGVLPTNVSSVALGPILESVATEFSVLAENRGLKLVVYPSSVWVRTDAALLKRILKNFLSNALRYTERGRIVFGARRVGGHVRVEVLDTGPGIAVEDQKRIFDEFQRLEGRDVRGERGVGLGLAICRRVADLLEHPLGLRSVEAKGSAFWVSLPRVAPVVSEPVSNRPAPVKTDRMRGADILCIDNDPDVLAGMQALLASWNCQVRIAATEDEAIACVEERLPQLIVADFHLDNGLTGVVLLLKLNEICGQKIPALIATADHTDEASEAAGEAGYRLLRKPIKPAALRALLSKMI